MRDVHDFKVPITRQQKLNGVITNTAVVSQQSVRSLRSESTPTSPLADGTYHTPTGYRAFFSLVSYQAFSVKWKTSTGNKYEYFGTGPELPKSIWQAGCDSTLYPDPSNYVISRARSSLDSQVRDDLNIAQFAGEARETAGLLAHVLGKLLVTVRNVRRLRKGGNWNGWYNTTVHDARKAARRGDRSARAYLAYMYGVRPLISEVNKIAAHWDQRCEAPVSKRLFAQVEETFTPLGVKSTRTVGGHRLRGVSTGAIAFVTNPQLLRASQYGLTSPLSLAWELTTLSFVVDWFTGIGAFIQGLEPPLGVSIRDYWETFWVDANFPWAIDYYREKGSPGTLDGPNQFAAASVSVKAMWRTNPTRLLPPPPYLNLGVSSSQVLSILALIRARV